MPSGNRFKGSGVISYNRAGYRRRLTGWLLAGLLMLLAAVGWGGCAAVFYPGRGPEPAATAESMPATIGTVTPAATAAPTRPPSRPTRAAVPEVIPPAVEVDLVSVNRIAYIGPYGDLFTINPDGTERRRLTGGDRDAADAGGPVGAYRAQRLELSESWAWPTWSPDGTRLAVSRVQRANDRSLRVSAQIVDAAVGRRRLVYENEVPALIADDAPHYLYWSPDGEYLSFLAATRQGLTLFVVNPDTAEGAIALERGAPLYYSWGGDGQSLIWHSRAAVKLLRKPFAADNALSLVDAVGFRTPAMSPDGQRWAVWVGGRQSGTLYIGERDNLGTAPAAILSAGPTAAFMWSPDGTQLAVADQWGESGGIFERLHLAAADGSGGKVVVEEPLLAFYWSPDGARLAWVAVDGAEPGFTWKVAEVAAMLAADGPVKGRELLRFQPSSAVLTSLTFFDQYAYSHTPWSPDGTQLVAVGQPGPAAERRNGESASGTRVYVLDAVGDEPPREIAAGGMAFWSWN